MLFFQSFKFTLDQSITLDLLYQLQIQMNRLQLRVRIQPCLAQFPSNTTLFHSTKRHAEITIVAGINPDHAGFQLASHTVSASNITRAYSSGKPVFRHVR